MSSESCLGMIEINRQVAAHGPQNLQVDRSLTSMPFSHQPFEHWYYPQRRMRRIHLSQQDSLFFKNLIKGFASRPAIIHEGVGHTEISCVIGKALRLTCPGNITPDPRRTVDDAETMLL